MSDETTTDTLAEIEGQAADYTPPEGWRRLQEGEVLQAGDEIVQLDDGKRHPTYLVGCSVGKGQRYIRRIELEPEPQPVHLQAMVDSQAETIARLNSEIHGLSIQNAELLAQREAVKDELVRQCENSRLLQIELDAREQVPQAVSDRFEEGWDAGTARAVETIAEWTEPLRKLIDAADNVEQTERASNLAADVMQNLPHIMRSLTGLTDED